MIENRQLSFSRQDVTLPDDLPAAIDAAAAGHALRWYATHRGLLHRSILPRPGQSARAGAQPRRRHRRARTSDANLDQVWNVINAVRAVHGVDIAHCVVTDHPIGARCRRNQAGAALHG